MALGVVTMAFTASKYMLANTTSSALKNSALWKKPCSMRALTWRVTPRYIRLKEARPSRCGRDRSICSITAIAPCSVDAVVHGGGKAIATATPYCAVLPSTQAVSLGVTFDGRQKHGACLAVVSGSPGQGPPVRRFLGQVEGRHHGMDPQQSAPSAGCVDRCGRIRAERRAALGQRIHSSGERSMPLTVY